MLIQATYCLDATFIDDQYAVTATDDRRVVGGDYPTLMFEDSAKKILYDMLPHVGIYGREWVVHD